MKTLNDFGIPDLSVFTRRKYKNKIYLEEIKMDENEYKKAENKELVEMKKEGDNVAGEFVSIEESKLYPSSYALTFKDNDKLKICFVNKIGFDLVMQYLKTGSNFKLYHKGKKKTEDGRNEYHTYEMFYK